MKKHKNILVTGGTGFIGSAVARGLSESGRDVTATFNTRRDYFYFGPDGDNCVNWVNADLSDSKVCDDITLGMDCVIICHATSFGAKYIKNNPIPLITRNTVSNVNIINSAVANGVKRIIFYGSTTGYPDLDKELVEDDMFIGDPPEQYFTVGWMKRYIEILLSAVAKSDPSFSYCSLRLSNVFGPCDKFDLETSHVLPAMINKLVSRHNPIEIWGDGSESRDLIYIDDVVEATKKSIDRKDSGAFNIGAGKNFTINEFVRIIMELENYYPEIRRVPNSYKMISSRRLNINKATEVLGFSPQYSLVDGLSKTIDWFKINKGRIYR